MIYEHLNGWFVPILASLTWASLIGLASFFLVYKTKLFDALNTCPLVPPFLALPAIMFAFLMGFMSTESWQNYSHGRAALINETAAIMRILNVPIEPEVFQTKSNTYIKSYLENVVNEEWLANNNESSSLKAQEALKNIEINIWQANAACAEGPGKLTSCSGSVATSALIKAVDDLQIARQERLSLGYQGTSRMKWLLGIMLGFISALSVVAVHKHNQKTGVIALILFCSSMWVTFSMVTLYINPYKWTQKLMPVPLISILETL
jgi:hypothetical protein